MPLARPDSVVTVPGIPVTFRVLDNDAGDGLTLVALGSPASGSLALQPDGKVLLLLTPATATALGTLMQGLGRRYGAAFNRRHGRRGTLWAGRFRTAVVQAGPHLLDAMLHVDLQGQAAGGGAAAWSSLGHRLGERRDLLITDCAAWWALGNTPFERNAAYGLLVMQPLQPAGRRRFDDAVRKGWALGSDSFLAGLAASTSRRVRPLTAGRPRKTP